MSVFLSVHNRQRCLHTLPAKALGSSCYQLQARFDVQCHLQQQGVPAGQAAVAFNNITLEVSTDTHHTPSWQAGAVHIVVLHCSAAD